MEVEQPSHERRAGVQPDRRKERGRAAVAWLIRTEIGCSRLILQRRLLLCMMIDKTQCQYSSPGNIFCSSYEAPSLTSLTPTTMSDPEYLKSLLVAHQDFPRKVLFVVH